MLPREQLAHSGTWLFRRRNYLPLSFLLSIIGAFTLVNLGLDCMAQGRVAFDPLWSAFLGVGALAYFSLRALHKKIDFLRIEGR